MWKSSSQVFDFDVEEMINSSLKSNRSFNFERYSVLSQISLAALLSVICVGTIVGNLLIIIAVFLVRRLHTPSNCLVFSLACSDFLVAVAVIPFAIITQIKGYWLFSEFTCDFFIFLDILLCTASILNLCCISIDRYFTILQPLSQYGTNFRPVFLMICIIWILSGLISIPPVTGWKEPFHLGHCTYSESLWYQTYATLGAFYIPLVVMLILYSRIYQVAKKIAKNNNVNQTFMGMKFTKNGPRDLILKQFSLIASPLNAIPLVKNSLNTNNRFSQVLTTENSFYKYNINDDILSVSKLQQRKSDESDMTNSDYWNSIKSKKARQKYLSKKIISESKAIKTLGILMGCFTFCWFPFFTLQLIVPVIKTYNINTKYIPMWVRETFLWLGYFNSFLNPIIYAKFNKDFRQPFKEILSCHCKSINNRLRTASYTEQFGKSFVQRRRSGYESTLQLPASRRSSSRPHKTPIHS
uniref:GCR019 n=1 Tax=Schmidtea mediterranea TaxID=79327 RepID=A0A193KUK9_SCHMD|nr:GCR019 [Schmidtea mediterranea]